MSMIEVKYLEKDFNWNIFFNNMLSSWDNSALIQWNELLHRWMLGDDMNSENSDPEPDGRETMRWVFPLDP